MKNRMHVLGIGMGILAIALVVGVFANKKALDNFSNSINTNDVLGASNINNVGPSDKNPYKIEVKETKLYEVDETSQTKRVSISAVVINNTNEVLQFSPGINTFLIDDNNNYYQYTAQFIPVETIVGGPINPDNNSPITLDYIIPSNANISKLILSVDTLIPHFEVYL